jgi:peptidyl-prolyl cis-trans isomerase SurA
MPGLRPLIVVAFACALAVPLRPAAAQTTIKLLVNDSPITTYDISQRARLMTLAGEKGGEKAATEQLIDEIVELQDAKRRGLVVPQAQIDAAFASIATNLKLSTKQLTAALASRGIDAGSLKSRLKAQIAWQQLVKARIQRDAAVKPSDVTAALFAESGSPDKITSTEFTLQQILFVVPKGSSTAYISQRKSEAIAYRSRFAGCDSSIAEAKKLRDVLVRDIGRRTATDLTGARGEEVKKTPVGKVTSPAQVDNGIELIAVCATRDIQTDAAARATVENKLALAQSKDVGTEYLKELRDKAIIVQR